MREINEVIDNVKFGSEIEISRNMNIYAGYMKQYDGEIFKDVKRVELGDFFESLSNIKELLDSGYTYQVSYNTKTNKYRSSISNESNNKESIYQVEDENFLDSIINLDTVIANDKSNDIEMKKVLTLS